MATSLLDVYNYSIKGDLSNTDKIPPAPTFVAAARSNQAAVSDEVTAAMALTQMGNEASLDIANKKFALDKAQIEGTKEFGASLANIFSGTADSIKQEHSAGFAAAQEAMQTRAELAKVSEEQNNTWNPVKKLALWWKRENLSDTVTNKMEEANAHFKSAAIAADVTSMTMQAAVTSDTLNRGFEQQAAQQLLQADAQRKQAELQALGSTLDTASKSREKVWKASQDVFQAMSWEDQREMQALQMKQANKELAVPELQAKALLAVRGITNPTKTDMEYALSAVSTMPAESRSAFNTVVFRYSRGARTPEKIFSGMTVGEVRKLGGAITELGAFAEPEMSQYMKRLVDEYDATSMKASPQFGKNPALFMNSPEGKAAHKENLDRAQRETMAAFDAAPALAVLSQIDTTAELPASFNPVSALTVNNGQVLATIAPNPQARAVLSAAAKPGGAIESAYTAKLAEYKGSLGASEYGPHVEAIALMGALRTTGISEKDAAEAVTSLYYTAAAASMPTQSPTISILQSIGIGKDLKPKIPAVIDGMPYDLTNKMDLMKMSRIMELRAKEMPFVSFKKPSTFGKNLVDIGTGAIPVVTPVGKGLIQGTSSVNSWLTDKVVTPLQSGK